jgi:CysZ protein
MILKNYLILDLRILKASMRELFLLFPQSFLELFSHKKLRHLTIAPIVITLFLYLIFALVFIIFIFPLAQAFLVSLIPVALSTIAVWGLSFIFIILFFILFNWTFVMLVSLICSPFNSLISETIEELEYPDRPEFVSLNWKTIVFLELRKFTIIFLLTIFALSLSFIPFLGIVSFALSAILLSISFLDYSWSRHQWTLSRGLSHYRENFLSFFIGGLFFMSLLAVPFINLLTPLWATSYFTKLWIKKNR